MTMKARIIISDPINRWQQGEVGHATKLPVGHKYDYQVDLGSVKVGRAMSTLLSNVDRVARVYYFYADEITLVD